MFWRKRKTLKRSSDPFRTVLATPWTKEYRGALPATRDGGIKHNLICAEITPIAAAILLEQGFRPINGSVPTHVIKCTSSMARDSYQPRALFDLYLDLKIISSANWQHRIAVKTCKGLKERLMHCTERALLVRCRTNDEFPWCIDDETLDFTWLDDGNRYLKAAMAEYESIRGV